MLLLCTSLRATIFFILLLVSGRRRSLNATHEMALYISRGRQSARSTTEIDADLSRRRRRPVTQIIP